MPQKLFTHCAVEGIAVYWFHFKPPVRGIYWCPDGIRPAIGLDHSLERNRRELRCVLSEEVGHHYTTGGNCLTKTFYSFRDRIQTSIEERRAMEWAATYLIPETQLIKAFKKNITTVWELAEYFDVTEEMVNFRLKMAGVKHRQGSVF